MSDKINLLVFSILAAAAACAIAGCETSNAIFYRSDADETETAAEEIEEQAEGDAEFEFMPTETEADEVDQTEEAAEEEASPELEEADEPQEEPEEEFPFEDEPFEDEPFEDEPEPELDEYPEAGDRILELEESEPAYDIDQEDKVNAYEYGPYTATIFAGNFDMPGIGPIPHTVNYNMYVPVERANAPFPVVIFSHGFQFSGGNYVSIAKRMASHGIIAVAPDWDNFFSMRTHSQLAKDVIALIDHLVAKVNDENWELKGVLDLHRLGAAGHSRGGKQSILASIWDERIKAVFALDPVDAAPPPPIQSDPINYPSVTPELMGGLNVPSGYVGAEKSAQAAIGGQACAPLEDNFHQYYLYAPSPAYEYFFLGAGHLDFVDDCGALCLTCVAGDNKEWVRQVSTGIMISFFKYFLDGDYRFKPWVDGAKIADLTGKVVFSYK